MSVSGSPRKFTHNGITYNVKADANVSRNPEKTVEGLRHTGGVSMQETLENAQLEAISLDLSVAEYQQLQAAVATGVHPSSFEYANGDVIRGDSQVVLGAHESQTNKCDITAIPLAGKWEAFLAS